MKLLLNLFSRKGGPIFLATILTLTFGISSALASGGGGGGGSGGGSCNPGEIVLVSSTGNIDITTGTSGCDADNNTNFGNPPISNMLGNEPAQSGTDCNVPNGQDLYAVYYLSTSGAKGTLSQSVNGMGAPWLDDFVGTSDSDAQWDSAEGDTSDLTPPQWYTDTGKSKKQWNQDVVAAAAQAKTDQWYTHYNTGGNILYNICITESSAPVETCSAQVGNPSSGYTWAFSDGGAQIVPQATLDGGKAVIQAYCWNPLPPPTPTCQSATGDSSPPSGYVWAPGYSAGSQLAQGISKANALAECFNPAPGPTCQSATGDSSPPSGSVWAPGYSADTKLPTGTSKTKALADCFNPAPTTPVCPDKTSTGTNSYIIRADGTAIPTAYRGSSDADEAEAGSFCYKRVDTITTQQTATRTRPGPTTTSSASYGPYPAGWGVTIQADPSAPPGTAGTNGGTEPGSGGAGQAAGFSTQSGGEPSDWGTLMGNTTTNCPSADDINTAVSNTGTEGEATLPPLSSANQTALALGMIAYVHEWATYDSLTDTTTTTTVETETGTYTQTSTITYSFSLTPSEEVPSGSAQNPTAGAPVNSNGPITWSGNWPITSSTSTCAPTVDVGTSSTTVHSFQILTSHGNPDGYSTAMSQPGVNENTISQTNQNLAEVGLTGDYGTSNTIALGYAPTNGNVGDRAGLFDKLASLTGANPSGSNGKILATTTYFRDGNQHPLDLEWWNPAISNGVTGNNGIMATTLNVYNESSPILEENSGGACLWAGTGYSDCPFMSIYNSSGTSMFSDQTDGTISPATQWGDPYQDNYEDSATSPGASTVFKIASTWVSNSKEPVVIGGYQIINANLTSNIPVNNIGFGGPGGAITGYQDGDVEAVSVPFNSILFATTGGSNPPLTTPVENSTGSQQFSNNADNPNDVIDCVGNAADINGTCNFEVDVIAVPTNQTNGHYTTWRESPNSYSPYYLAYSFARGTGE